MDLISSLPRQRRRAFASEKRLQKKQKNRRFPSSVRPRCKTIRFHAAIAERRWAIESRKGCDHLSLLLSTVCENTVWCIIISCFTRFNCLIRVFAIDNRSRRWLQLLAGRGVLPDRQPAYGATSHLDRLAPKPTNHYWAQDQSCRCLMID